MTIDNNAIVIHTCDNIFHIYSSVNNAFNVGNTALSGNNSNDFSFIQYVKLLQVHQLQI